MLRKAKSTRTRTVGGHFAIVASKYNPRFVDSMLAAARNVLRPAGASQTTWSAGLTCLGNRQGGPLTIEGPRAA